MKILIAGDGDFRKEDAMKFFTSRFSFTTPLTIASLSNDYFNPLKVFLPVGFSFFVAAIFVFMYSAFFLGRFMDVTTIVLVVAAIQTVLFGLLADLVVRRSE